MSHRPGDDSNLSVFRSDINKNGDPRTLLSKRHQVIDLIDFTISEKPDFSKDFVEKYEKGFSAKEIGAQYGCSKQKVLAALKRNKVNIRPARAFTTSIASSNKGRRGRKAFYGFCYFEGEITKHPTEFPILQSIYKMWLEGKSIHSINLDLHKRKIKAREGGKWSWAALRNIIERFKLKQIVIHNGGKYELR